MTTVAEAFRDYNTEGVSASGNYQPDKSVIRAWGAGLETSIAALDSGLSTASSLTPVVNPVACGASPLASAAENTAALLAAYATGKAIQWPLGEFAMDPCTIDIANGESFSMRGMASHGTKLVFATGGIRLRFTRSNSPLMTGASSIDISQMSFLASGENIPYALYCDYSAVSEGAVVGSGTRVTIRDCGTSYYSDSSHYFAIAFRFYNVTDSTIANCQFRGPAGDYLGVAVRYMGDDDGFPNGVVNKVSQCLMSGFNIGIHHTAPGESLLLNQNVIQANNGVFADWDASGDELTEPHIAVIGGHINAKSRGVYSRNWQGVIIQGVLFYMEGNADSPVYAIDIARPDATEFIGPCNISNNIFQNVAFPLNTRAVLLGDNVGLAVVDGNMFVNYGRGVELVATTKACRGANFLYAGSPGNALVDAGTGNLVTVATIAAF